MRQLLFAAAVFVISTADLVRAQEVKDDAFAALKDVMDDPALPLDCNGPLGRLSKEGIILYCNSLFEQATELCQQAASALLVSPIKEVIVSRCKSFCDREYSDKPVRHAICIVGCPLVVRDELAKPCTQRAKLYYVACKALSDICPSENMAPEAVALADPTPTPPPSPTPTPKQSETPTPAPSPPPAMPTPDGSGGSSSSASSVSPMETPSSSYPTWEPTPDYSYSWSSSAPYYEPTPYPTWQPTWEPTPDYSYSWSSSAPYEPTPYPTWEPTPDYSYSWSSSVTYYDPTPYPTWEPTPDYSNSWSSSEPYEPTPYPTW